MLSHLLLIYTASRKTCERSKAGNNGPKVRETYDLSDIDGDLRRADADSQTIDDTANNQHADVLRGTNKDGTNAPDHTADLNGPLSSQNIRQVTRDQGTKP